MKKRVIALMLAFVLVLNMGTVAFANGEATPAPVTETEPTPTQEVEATLTPAPIAEAPSPVAEVIPTPTSEVVLESISVTQTPDKLEYLCTDTVVDSTGGLLTLTFSDRTTQTVDLSVATLSLVKEAVNVTYEDMTDSFAVTVTHSYDEGVVTTEATATEPGVITYTCADCGDTQTGEVPMAASTVIASGTCGVEGDNLTWELSDDGMLTISGTGAMDDYSPDTDNAPWYEYRSNIKSVVIGNGVTSIGVSAFNYCYSLTSVDLPDGLTSIGDAAFNTCYSLTNIDIPDGVTRIGENTFDYCTRLTSVELPDSVTCIDDRAFISCHSLTSITIPNSVTNIGSYAFWGCRALESITIPDGVTSIGDSAFYGCSSLISITIPDSVTSIGGRAFSGCSSLSSITIPDGVTSIGGSAFSGCSSLSSITIPDGVTSIDYSAFRDCSALESIIVPFVGGAASDNAYLGYIFGANSYSSNNDYVPASLKNVTVTGGTTISANAFAGCNYLENITIPNSVTTIGQSAFYGCNSLSSITIPFVGGSASDNTYLGYIFGASSYSSNDDYVPASLKSVTVTVGTTIPSYAFYGCNYLERITIPASVTKIGSSAFYGCSRLSNVHYSGTQTEWNSITIASDNSALQNATKHYECSGCAVTWKYSDGILTISGTGVMDSYKSNYLSSRPWHQYISKINEIVIQPGITGVGNYAFYGCSALESITIPDSVTNIGEYAFRGCTGLTSITIPDSVTNIGEYAFRGCTGLTSITIPDSVTSIGSSVFDGCTGLTSITMPASAICAFSGCSNITLVTLTKGSGVIPNYVSSYGTYFPPDNYYKRTPWYASRNNNITVTIEEGVTSIGKNAFYGCTGLTSITIPDKVASIGDLAFQDCSGLTEITFKGDAPTIADGAFTNVTATAKYLHMKNWPEDALENYGGTLTWQICCENFEECEIVTDEAVAPTFDSTGLTEGSHCSVCEKPIVAQNELPKLAVTELEITAPDKLVYYKGESLDSTGLTVTAKLNNDTNIDVTDQVQLEGFSSNAAGTKTITVSFKDAQATFDVQVFSFTSVSLSLEGRVIINFYANFPDYAEAGYTPGILFFRKQPDGDEIVAAYNAGEGVTSYVVADNGALMFSYDKLAAKELNDKVYATLYAVQDDGKVVFGTPTPISAAEYAISTFGLYANDARLQTLMVDMLNFGAAAQNEFDYRTDALANSNMSATMAAKATKDNVSLSNGMKLYKDGLSSDKVTIKSASLSLDNEISINFYAEIKGDIKKAELLIFDEYTAGGVYDKNTASKRTDMVPHEDMYAGFITGIAAKSMRDLYYARVYVQFEDGTEAYSGIGQYSVESYAWQVRNGSGFSSKLKLLMEEMMKYGDSAKMYMENKNNNANG